MSQREGVRRVPDPSGTFAEFVTTRSPGLQRTAYLLTGDHQHAEDLVQTALLKAARVWPRIEARPDAMSGGSSTTRASRVGAAVA
ncbi:MAG: sigma factor [Nocardioidaceae bacterium]